MTSKVTPSTPRAPSFGLVISYAVRRVHLADVNVWTPETPGRFSLRLDGPQVIRSMDAFISSSLLSLCWRLCKWQGPLAPRTLLSFIATAELAATLSSSADFSVSPVIRPTLLRRFLAGTKRASLVAWHVLVTALSLPPRQCEQPCQSDFGCSNCLRPLDAGLAFGDTHFRGVASPRETLSIGFRVSVSITSAIQNYEALTLAPAGLSPAEHASLCRTHVRR
jgi:hypothetical protein